MSNIFTGPDMGIPKTTGVFITKQEAESLEDFIWCGLLPYIRNTDLEIDNLEWVWNICNVWKKCKEAGEQDEIN